MLIDTTDVRIGREAVVILADGSFAIEHTEQPEGPTLAFAPSRYAVGHSRPAPEYGKLARQRPGLIVLGSVVRPDRMLAAN